MVATDAEIAKCMTVLKTYTLADGVTITPAVPEHDPKYAKAKNYADFCTFATRNIEGTRLVDVVEQLLDCLIYGHKVGEITYELKDLGKKNEDFGLSSGSKYLVKHIKVKPQKSLAFVVDQFNNVLGFKARPIVGFDYAIDSTKTVIIPREKFVVFTFRAKDSDPRGTSILRAVYNAWHLKMTMWPEYLRWLTNCAVPGLVGIAAPPENQEKVYVMNPDGSVAVDGQGNPILIPATSQLANALEQIRNASVIAVPNGTVVTPIGNQTSSEPFKTAKDVLNQEIEMALLLQTLATTSMAHGSRAASQVALTVLDVLIFYIKQMVADSIKRDIITQLVTLNFPDVDVDLIPTISLGDTERRSWSIDGVAASTMYANGLLKDSQLPSMYEQLGIVQPAEGDLTKPNVAQQLKIPQPTTGPGVTQTPTNQNNNSVQPTKTASVANTPANTNAAGG
jgi:hypothetical protein